MEIRDLERIRFVTLRFHDLQGLRILVPVGLLVLSGAGAPDLTGWPLVLLRAVLFSGAMLLLLGARRYYRSVFGEVERPRVQRVADLASLSIFSPAGPVPLVDSPLPVIPAAQRYMLILGLAPTALFLFHFLFLPPWVTVNSEVVSEPIWTSVPVVPSAVIASATQMVAPLCGSLFLAIWWMRGRRLSQGHHLAIGALLSAFSVLGAWLVPAAAHPGVALFLCGSAMVLAGLLDHWQLVRVLGRPVAAGEEE